MKWFQFLAFFCLLFSENLLSADELVWLDNYGEAIEHAKASNQKLLIAFNSETASFPDSFSFKENLKKVTLLQIPIRDSKESDSSPLFNHPAFEGLKGRPGMAIIDYQTHGANRGRVIGTLPYVDVNTSRLVQFLDLPLTWEWDRKLQWHSDYGDALEAARQSGKWLFISFEKPGDHFPTDPRYLKRLQDNYILLRLPLDYALANGQPLRSHVQFFHLEGQSGIAIMDANSRQTISLLPRSYFTVRNIDALLSLPPGTLTQRTLVWAVRIHRENPPSTLGSASLSLMKHAEGLAQAQANCSHCQHAMQFGYRTANCDRSGQGEICAQTYPASFFADRRYVIAASIDAVDGWRGSSGHWASVNARWAQYGYDIKYSPADQRWYATGIFR